MPCQERSDMCWYMRKTPARFPSCKGKPENNCINFDPFGDYFQWCMPAEQRGRQCEVPIISTQASSTKRGKDCPRHRPIPSPTGQGGSAGSQMKAEEEEKEEGEEGWRTKCSGCGVRKNKGTSYICYWSCDRRFVKGVASCL